MRSIRMAAVLAGSLALAGCEGMSQTQQTTALGAGGGALLGGAIGSFSGNAGLGALLGAGAGGVGGYLYDQSRQNRGGSYYRR